MERENKMKGRRIDGRHKDCSRRSQQNQPRAKTRAVLSSSCQQVRSIEGIEAFYENVFKMMLLMLSEEDQLKIRSAKVGLAGVGGVGCSALEALLRNGVSNLRIADVDWYEPHNYRQLYCTQRTIGRSKLDVVVERVHELNPYCHLELYRRGVTHENYFEFCKGLDVICVEVDKISVALLLHYAASIYGIPVVNGGRAEWPERHTLAVFVKDYRRDDVKFEMDSKELMRRWGIEERITEALKSQITSGRVDPQLLAEMDEQNFRFRQATFRQAVLKTPEAISEKSKEYLQKVIQNNPCRFHKMVVTPQGVMIVGAMVAQHMLDIILDREINRIAVNIYRGKAYPFSKDNI